MEPDTLVVWLLKQARVWEGPGWECPMCGKPHQDISSWPCCAPIDRGWTYTDFQYRSEHGRNFSPPAKMVGPILDLWDLMGLWDKKFSTWEAQLKQVFDAYDEYAQAFEAAQQERAHIEAAQTLVREAMLACLVSNGGKPLTITELVRAEPKLCEEAAGKMGLGGSVRHGVFKILEQDPEARQVGARRGFPVWTLSDQLLAEHGFDGGGGEVELERVKRELVRMANILIQETGHKSWTAKKFMARFQEPLMGLLNRLDNDSPQGRDLGLLFAQFQDTFCVVGRGQNVAHWALQEDAVEANQHLHEDQFAKFTGAKREGST